MVMKSVCTLKNQEEAEGAANAFEVAGCETELVENANGTWTVRSDGRFVTRTAMEKF